MTTSEPRYRPLPTEIPSGLCSNPHHAVEEHGAPSSLQIERPQRNLQERHLSMIALAGMIGTGLFLSSGRALVQAGPLGCVLGFMIMGTVTASIAYSSAEMSAFKPVSGGFVRHATMWIDESTGLAIGYFFLLSCNLVSQVTYRWNFWYSMAITMPTEISAATTLLGFWNSGLDDFIPITIFWVVIAIINFSPVRVYGEFEFYFAFLKVAVIVGFIIGGLVLDLGGFAAQERLGFRYWSHPYPLFREYVTTGLQGRFLGFWSTMILAAFAYGNVQVVAIAGAETRDPRKAIPNALKRTFFRVVFFYVASILVISLTVPADDERLRLETGNANQSPFVVAFNRAGITAFPSIINAVVLTSAFSSGNSCTFLASRTLYGLALDGHAPSLFLKLNRFGVPYVAVAASVIWGGVAYLSLDHGAYQAFLWLVSLVTTAGILSWVIIGVTYLRFFYALRAQRIPRSCLPYRSPFQPYITYYGLGMNILILLCSGWISFYPTFSPSLFFSNYLNCLIYPALYFGCKMWFRDKIIPLNAIDFHTEFAIMEVEDEELHKTSFYDRRVLLLYGIF
ncbi:amino acid permease/ SLC12A domain-containing protein [Crassisporium funariophilum]|nr:amino acid permease/ SLC12A domain-containing protein [Crassisporium funariophilum]